MQIEILPRNTYLSSFSDFTIKPESKGKIVELCSNLREKTGKEIHGILQVTRANVLWKGSTKSSVEAAKLLITASTLTYCR